MHPHLVLSWLKIIAEILRIKLDLLQASSLLGWMLFGVLLHVTN